jgi:hypothetical protein
VEHADKKTNPNVRGTKALQRMNLIVQTEWYQNGRSAQVAAESKNFSPILKNRSRLSNSAKVLGPPSERGGFYLLVPENQLL